VSLFILYLADKVSNSAISLLPILALLNILAYAIFLAGIWQIIAWSYHFFKWLKQLFKPKTKYQLHLTVRTLHADLSAQLGFDSTASHSVIIISWSYMQYWCSLTEYNFYHEIKILIRAECSLAFQIYIAFKDRMCTRKISNTEFSEYFTSWESE